MFKIWVEPEWPKEGACLKIYEEPELPNEGACVRYIMKRRRQMRRRVVDI